MQRVKLCDEFSSFSSLFSFFCDDVIVVFYFYNSNNKSKKAIEVLNNGGILIDVRTPQEFASGNYKNSINIPLNTIEQNLEKIKLYNKKIILVCASGMRSGQANEILNRNGIDSVNGGSWSKLKQSYFE